MARLMGDFSVLAEQFDVSAETPREALQEVLENTQQHESLEDLADFVARAMREARAYRQREGIDEAMLQADRAVACKYDPEDAAMLTPNEVYYPITSLKVRAAKAWIMDIFSTAHDKPWTLEPTPAPSLPDAIETVLAARLEAEIQQIELSGAQPTPEELQRRASQLKRFARKFVDQGAREALEGMERRIHDNLIQGNWREAFEALISDIVQYPVAVLKGPFTQRVPYLKWDGDQLKAVEGLRMQVSRVDPYDAYFAPGACNPQEGAYFIEVVRLTPTGLLSHIGVPGFEEIAIRAALEEYQRGYRIDMLTTTARRDNETDLDPLSDSHEPAFARHEIMVFYGKVPNDLLQRHGIELGSDPQNTREAEIWVLGDYVLKAVLNPHPLGHRPYFSTSYFPVPGSPWGRSIPAILRDIQRIANATIRSLVRNMAYSSGPIVEVDAGRLPNEANIDEIFPYRVYRTVTDPLAGNNGPALRFNQSNPMSNDLLRVLEVFSKEADDASGIPAYVLGNPQIAGAGRTLGGLAMLLGNAAKGIKQVIGNLDKHIIEPLIYSFYTLELLYGDDATIKADAQVVARGAAGIMQRELAQANAIDLLQALTPYMADPEIVPKSAIQKLLREIVSSMGFSADELIPDPDRQQDLAQAVVGPQAEQARNIRPLGPKVDLAASELNLPKMPELDGRSAPADTVETDVNLQNSS